MDTFIVHLDKPIQPQLKYLGVERDIPELMEFSCFDGYDWNHIHIYFKAALARFYVGDEGSKRVPNCGNMYECLSAAENVDLKFDKFSGVHPFIRVYIEKFAHLGWEKLKVKFRSDFMFWAWRSHGYQSRKASKTLGVTGSTVSNLMNKKGKK